MERQRSYVTAFYDNAWGFINGKKLGIDRIYFRKSAIRSGEVLHINDTVEFLLIKNPMGYEAQDIIKIDRVKSEFNTEDKDKWTEIGYKLEVDFVKNIAPKFGNNNLIEHPKKKEFDWYIDLYDKNTESIADLKCQRTPFFTANKYNFNPQYTVTFNKNDYEKYRHSYKKFTEDKKFSIYWWVSWTTLNYSQKDKDGQIYKVIEVLPLNGVWEVQFCEIASKIENAKVPLHSYESRKEDKINAKDSYLFDLRWFNQLL